MEINYILLDLEIIKQIKPDDKLGLIILPGKKSLFVDSNSNISSITRWYRGDDREATIEYLEQLVEKIEKFSIFLKNGNHKYLTNTLMIAINNGTFGLENLKLTYELDSIIVAKLVLIINKLMNIKKILENIYNETECMMEILNDNINEFNNQNT